MNEMKIIVRASSDAEVEITFSPGAKLDSLAEYQNIEGQIEGADFVTDDSCEVPQSIENYASSDIEAECLKKVRPSLQTLILTWTMKIIAKIFYVLAGYGIISTQFAALGESAIVGTVAEVAVSAALGYGLDWLGTKLYNDSSERAARLNEGIIRKI
jgi:hypothetical protein